jgi:RNA 2',3'-cyclic 3'-phosphodiesterase
MRLFTAIELGDGVRSHAAVLLDELRVRARRFAPGAKVTWVAPERMHLTLRFIGEMNDTESAAILGALRSPIGMPAFTVRWEGLGSFPARGAPRVLWIGVAEGRDALIEAERSVSARLESVGIPREDRPYSPHLTLARVREPAGLKAAPLFEGLDSRLGKTHVGAITLFQSQLSPKGPTYVMLQQTSLSRI